MKKNLFCGMMLSACFSFGQSVNITDPETLISYSTRYVTMDDGQLAYIMQNTISTPEDITAAINEQRAPDGIRIIRGPKATGDITLGNGQTVYVKVCGQTDQSWCGLEWASR